MKILKLSRSAMVAAALALGVGSFAAAAVAQDDVTFDRHERPTGTAWKARVEHYLTDPEEQPNPEKWETKLAFLTRG